jgi:hypothetical protein
MKRAWALCSAGVGALGGLLVGCAPVAAATGPAPGSPAYLARDVENMAAAFGRNVEQVASPQYMTGLPLTVASTYLAQLRAQAADPVDPALSPGNLVPGWNAGDPNRSGWNGRRGRERSVRFSAPDGAVLAGRLFAPLAGAHDPYSHQALPATMPGVVIVTGSIQASAGMYTWLAEDLAERGYLVLTFDVQGQGQSGTLPHDGPVTGCATSTGPTQATPCDGFPSEQQQSFLDDAEAAITFFLSTPSARYGNPYGTATSLDAYNPWWSLFDRSADTQSVTPGRTTKLAIVGHSTGAVTVSYLQGVDRRVESAIALDKITATDNAVSDDKAELGALPGPVVPVVPTLGLQAEYGFEPQPYWEAGCSSFEPCPAAPGGSVAPPDLAQAPDPRREEATGFDTWVADGVDSMVIVPRASTHLDFTDEPPVLPASRWGQAMASYYAQAWLDQYLKHDPSAEARLLATTLDYLEPVGRGAWRPVTIQRDTHLSFYFCSGYALHGAAATRASADITGVGCR